MKCETKEDIRDELIRIRTILDMDAPKGKQLLTVLIDKLRGVEDESR